MDAGRMYAFEECEISPDDNYTSLCKKIVDCGKRVLKNNLDLYFEGKLQGIEQDEKLVTFADKISSFDEKVDLSKTTKKLLNWIRGLSEEPGGYILLNDLKVKILKAHKISDDITSEVGTLIINKRTNTYSSTFFIFFPPYMCGISVSCFIIYDFSGECALYFA